VRQFKQRRSRRRAEVGALTWVALAILQPLTGILSDLAVALLPHEWAQRRAILIITMLLIAIALYAFLQIIVTRFSSLATSPTPPGTDDLKANGINRNAFETTSDSTERSLSAREGNRTDPTSSPSWVEAGRSALEGLGEVLAILGLFVRWLAWRINRPKEDEEGGQDAKEKVAAARRRWMAGRPGWDQYSRNVGVGSAAAVLLLFLMTSTSPPSPAVDQASTAAMGLTKLVMTDSLNSPSPIWPQDSQRALQQRGSARFFKARTYHLVVRRQDTRLTSVPNNPLLRSLGDSRVQASVRPVETTSEGHFGLLCRQQSDRYYLAAINANGEYEIAKVSGAGKRIIVTGSMVSTTAANVSVLELICTGGVSGAPVTLTLRVNGSPVVTGTDSLEPLLGSVRASGRRTLLARPVAQGTLISRL
jgi:hypothetical protein